MFKQVGDECNISCLVMLVKEQDVKTAKSYYKSGTRMSKKLTFTIEINSLYIVYSTSHIMIT